MRTRGIQAKSTHLKGNQREDERNDEHQSVRQLVGGKQECTEADNNEADERHDLTENWSTR